MSTLGTCSLLIRYISVVICVSNDLIYMKTICSYQTFFLLLFLFCFYHFIKKRLSKLINFVHLFIHPIIYFL